MLDTGVVGALGYAGSLAERIDRETGIRAAPQRPLISVVTHGELRTFIRYRKWGEKRREGALAWLDHLVTVPLNAPKLHESFADLKVFSKQQGRSIGDNDLWIAATARATGATLLTTDKDFEPFADTWIDRVYFDPKWKKT